VRALCGLLSAVVMGSVLIATLGLRHSPDSNLRLTALRSSSC
jgi:hypothetical protein